MPNGKPGDNPVTDVVVWGREVYGTEVDALVREVAALMPDELEVDDHGYAIDSPFDEPPLVDLIFAAESDPSVRPRLRDELAALRDRLRRDHGP
jgi:hypothetical protein